MLARIMHSELLVASMHAEPDASEPALPESPGFVVVVSVCWGTRKFIDKFSERGNNKVISCMCTVCRDVYRVMLARKLHSELLVARMHAEPDASEPALPESPGFVVVVTVRWCTRASSLMELVDVTR